MSFINESCSQCWLPPLPDSTRCRLCTQKKIPFNSLPWVLYHTPSTNCKEFRKLIHENTYYGSVLPENCIQCYSFLTTQLSWIHNIRLNLAQQTYAKLFRMFTHVANERREALLDYITMILDLSKDDTELCKKITQALIHVFKGKEVWILEELVQRPWLYSLLIHQPIQIPDYLQEDFFGFFENTEAWWAFWEKMHDSTKRRIRFRCLTYKDELLAVAWHPRRVFKWCLDSEYSLK